MLEIATRGFFSQNYQLRTPEQELVVLATSLVRDRAQFTWRTELYRMYRERAFGGDFLLERGATITARARKPSALRDHFELDLGGRSFTLKRRKRWRSEFLVVQAGAEVGRIERRGFTRRHAYVDVPADWPLPFQLFVFWLVQLMWRRSDAAAAG